MALPPQLNRKENFMDLTNYSLDTVTVLQAGSIVVIALGTIWVVRKIIAMTNKS